MFNVRLAGEMAVHLAVARDVFDGFLSCAVFFPQDNMYLSWVYGVDRNFCHARHHEACRMMPNSDPE